MELEETGLYRNHTASKATIGWESGATVAHHMGKELILIPKRSLGVMLQHFCVINRILIGTDFPSEILCRAAPKGKLHQVCSHFTTDSCMTGLDIQPLSYSPQMDSLHSSC